MASSAEGSVAAIDCGTNSTRLLIADAAGNTLVREMRITRLGQGVDDGASLAPDAVERTLAVLRGYRDTMDGTGVARGRMVATSAVRDAENASDFLTAAAEIVGFPAELLSGEDEGLVAFAGAAAELPPIEADDVMVDIGGGSTELVVRREGNLSVVSLDMGCVRLTERCLITDPPRPAEVAHAEKTVRRHLNVARDLIPALADLPPDSRLVGLAGTVSTLAALVLGLREYRRDQVHHAILPFESVTWWATTLLAEPSTVRALRPAIVPGREDVIAGGALILREVMSVLKMDGVIVSEADILDGLIRSMTEPAQTG